MWSRSATDQTGAHSGLSGRANVRRPKVRDGNDGDYTGIHRLGGWWPSARSVGPDLRNIYRRDHFSNIPSLCWSAGRRPKCPRRMASLFCSSTRLAEGNLAARIYAEWLSRFLDWIERFFGDQGSAGQRAFGLRKPVSLRTGSAFDICLLLAFIYPLGIIFITWMVSGAVGPAEAALHFQPESPVWRRTLAATGVALCVFIVSRPARRYRWGAVVFVTIVAISIITGSTIVGVSLVWAFGLAYTGLNSIRLYGVRSVSTCLYLLSLAALARFRVRGIIIAFLFMISLHFNFQYISRHLPACCNVIKSPLAKCCLSCLLSYNGDDFCRFTTFCRRLGSGWPIIAFSLLDNRT